MSINRFTATGNLTRDPELYVTDSATPVVTMDIAVNDRWTDDEGQRQERVTFLRVKDFGKKAENHHQYLRKGDRVVVEGRMQNFMYEKEGVKHYGIDFICNYVEYPPKS